MVRREQTTRLRGPKIPPEENSMSRRYLRILQKWIPVGMEYFADWPERPECGHFLGGVHWYGNETEGPAEAFAAASISPEHDEEVCGASREEIQDVAIRGLRYLCFTHDTGPPDCTRPDTGLGRPENCSTKWGERGKGFFRESQCGDPIAGLGRISLMLRDLVDSETWMMVARIHEDYGERFGDMDPRSGVYADTQMEENAWTAMGLTSCHLFLPGHQQAPTWSANARRWMFSACSAPKDAKNEGTINGSSVRELANRTFTMLPDYMAENHGMVHPTYTASGVHSLGIIGVHFGLWGEEIPPELLWNRRRICENLKALTDGAGYPQAVQGMDWAYLRPVGTEIPHAVASVFFGDSDAAALQLRSLRQLEIRQEGNGGRLYRRNVAEKAHDKQDPMIMREATIRWVARLYLLHRLFGPGAEPTPWGVLKARLRGVRVFPHGGFVHHRHRRGQTSFSWRNSVMALPLPDQGIMAISPCTGSWLGQPKVRGRPDSQDLVDVRIVNEDDAFALAMVMDRCQRSLRQQVLFASLPDGRVLSHERFVSLEDVLVESVDQGFLGIANEHFPGLGRICRGSRKVHHEGGSATYHGWIGDSEGDDLVESLPRGSWINVDEVMGIRYRGTGGSSYCNRHYFQPFRGIVDDLVLSGIRDRKIRAGREVSSLRALVIPGQGHLSTPSTSFLSLRGPRNSAAMLVVGYLAAANFEERGRLCRFRTPRDSQAVAVASAKMEIMSDAVVYSLFLEGRSPALLGEAAVIRTRGRLRVDPTADGALLVTNLGRRKTACEILVKGHGSKEMVLGPGQTRPAGINPA